VNEKTTTFNLTLTEDQFLALRRQARHTSSELRKELAEVEGDTPEGLAKDVCVEHFSGLLSANEALLQALVEQASAAPDLLRVLKSTLSHAVGHACDARGCDPSECEEWPWVQAAREAIAKAEGGEA